MPQNIPSRIRPLAICIFSHRGHILAAEGYDPVKDQTFYRPLGGGIEFGEYAEQTLVRELREELNAEIKDLRYLGTLENIFTFQGEVGHEIVLVYDGAFVDETPYEQGRIPGYEANMDAWEAVWKPMDEFGPGKPPLYPDGLLELLAQQFSM